MIKVIIIGSSIAGASLANFLADKCDVSVYEQKTRRDVGKKLCANIVTSSFLGYSRKLGLSPEKYVISKFNNAIAISGSQIAKFKTNEFKIDRIKLVEDIIRCAERKKVDFNFECEFISFKKEKKGYAIKLKKSKRILDCFCDILVGADGPLSKVSKQAGLWKNRRFLLAMQSEIPLKKLNIEKDSYYIYLGKEKFGYYGYVFPSQNKAIIGMSDYPKEIRKKYEKFLKTLNLKNIKKEVALFPEPEIIPQKKDLFVIGDAGCHTKFSGGGIIPAIMAAEAVSDIILRKDYEKLKRLNERTYIHKLATKIIQRFKESEFDNLLKILKDKKFESLLEKRDEFSRKDYVSFIDLRLFKYLLKIF